MYLKHWNWLDKNKEWASIPLRLIAGIMFIMAGFPKLFVNLQGTAGFFDGLGIPLPMFFALVVGIVEFFGGIMLILGLLTRCAATFQSITMIVALLLVHLNGGYEKALLLLGMTLALVFLGSKKIALDNLLFKNK